MMELLHATGVRLGLVTNGNAWMLVNAPRGQTTATATWYASLWTEEPLTLRAFKSLLDIRRFVGVAADSTIEQMLERDGGKPEKEPLLNPILPPITGGNPATA